MIHLSAIKVEEKPKFDDYVLHREDGIWKGRITDGYGGCGDILIKYEKKHSEKQGTLHVNSSYAEYLVDFYGCYSSFHAAFKKDSSESWRFDKFEESTMGSFSENDKRRWEKHLAEFLKHKDAKKWLEEREDQCSRTEEFQKRKQT